MNEREYSPGLKDVLAGETSLALVDGERGRLYYSGYPIGELVEAGTYAQVAELLWTGEWPTTAILPCAPLPKKVLETLRLLPPDTGAMDALRTAISMWGADEGLVWPPTVEQARAVTALWLWRSVFVTMTCHCPLDDATSDDGWFASSGDSPAIRRIRTMVTASSLRGFSVTVAEAGMGDL